MNTFTLDNIGSVTQRSLSGGGHELAFESANTGMCHQLYVDASLQDWTEDPLCRRFVLPIDAHEHKAVIAAVPYESRAKSFATLLPPAAKSTCVFEQSVLPPVYAENSGIVLWDDHAGQSQPSIVALADCRRAWHGRLGLGLDCFGVGELGYGDVITGLGNGSFALGRFGFDVLAVQLQAVLQEEGLHHLTLSAVRNGQETIVSTQSMLVLPPPPPVETIQAVHYDAQTCKLTLHIK
jgi:hypothetical protein